ncbi:MAG TPA: GDP-mannose 4,6-dehydratase [Xanthobacteraceae bacterium]|nr:GDP-mannose 4,6-dehydratase [Xanthobacteraceae bacterium]
MAKTALVSGITGQDGAYLAKFLLDKGYRVVGAIRRSASANLARLKYLKIDRDVEFVECELLELSNVVKVIEHCRPDELYNLAGQSFVESSFRIPIYTIEVDGVAVVRLLEAIRAVNPSIRFYQASSSEMFGNAQTAPQDETTPFRPRSPYGVGKLLGHSIAVNYRESYGQHCVCGILFNHESPLRGRDFVTRRITLGLAGVKHGQRQFVSLGNLDAQRDWGFAADYVEGMWRMVQQDTPDDYVLATGKTTSVRAFAAMAGKFLGFDLEWSGSGADEIGIDRRSGKTIVRVDKELYRPADINTLVGSPKKALSKLGWKHRIDVDELAAMMAEADDRRVRADADFI